MVAGSQLAMKYSHMSEVEGFGPDFQITHTVRVIHVRTLQIYALYVQDAYMYMYIHIHCTAHVHVYI